MLFFLEGLYRFFTVIKTSTTNMDLPVMSR